MEFKILGPLEVVEDDRPIRLGRGREGALLALLLLRANEVVSTDVLIEELWRGEPPATAAKSLQVYVSRLRKRLGADALVTRAPGYAVFVDHDELDLFRFHRIVDEARANGALEAASMLREALSLWRGAPLAEYADEPFAQAEVGRLEELRLATLEDRIDADLAVGRHAELVGELETLVSRNPYRERLVGQLMLALYRSGRQAEALAVYREMRRALNDELGLEPADELRDLERQILAHDRALAAPSETRLEDPQSHQKGRAQRRGVLALVVVLLAVGMGIAAVGLGRSQARPELVASPSSVALIDPRTNRVIETIRVGDRPTRIVARGDAVWILHPDIRTLTLVSRAERKVLGTVGLGGAPSGLAVDRHGVWVTDALTGTITLIDPERYRVIGQIRTRQRRPPANDPGGALIAFGHGSIWFATGNSTVLRIDPTTRRIIARIRGVFTGESLGGIAFGRDAVWVAGPVQESTVTRIDPSTNKIAASVHAQWFRLNGIALAGRSVWVSDVGNDQVWAIDAVRNQPIGTTKVGGQPLGVASAAGSIWVANSGDGTVSRIDPITRQVVATIPVGASPNGVTATEDEIWVTVD